MIAQRVRSYRFHGGTARVSAWHGRPDVAAVALQGASPPTPRALARLLDRLGADGVREVITNALGPGASVALIDAGFRVRARLHLLQHDLAHLDDPVAPTRRLAPAQHPAVLPIDAASFDEFWRFDAVALAEAVAATPHTDVLVVPHTGAPVAYGVFGLGGTTGYVQRLAVLPEARGRGLALALLADGLRRLRERGATTVYVNTQADNEVALALYRRAGFVRLPVGLCIMGRSL